MDRDQFEKSKTSGPHHLLSQLVGDWEGITKTWFEPGKLADESANKGSIRAILDGRFVKHEYESTLEGNPYKGIAIYGHNLQMQKFEAAWIDTFHMSTGIMFSQGKGMGKGFSVLGSYDDPSGGPSWGWRTEIEILDPDNIVITAYNIAPGGEEAKAVETKYSRKQ